MRNKKGAISFILFLLLLVSFAGAKNNKITIPFKLLFQYDHSLPLRAKEEKIAEKDNFIRYHITYLNNRGEEVPAILTIPVRLKPPYEVVFFQHGMGDTKDCRYMLEGTDEFIKRGYAVFAIDALSFGERATPVTKDTSPAVFFKYPYLLRNIFIQTTIDVLRGIDYLQTRDDINAEGIYYVGNSMGSLYGVMLVALDKRLKRAVFIVGGADYQKKMRSMIYVMGIPASEFELVEPKNYVGMISPRPLLLINALRDGLIPREAALALFEAAEEPKKQVWMDSEHDIPIREGVEIIVRWFKERDKKKMR